MNAETVRQLFAAATPRNWKVTATIVDGVHPVSEREVDYVEPPDYKQEFCEVLTWGLEQHALASQLAEALRGVADDLDMSDADQRAQDLRTALAAWEAQ